ncbi:MAG: DUF5606 domain-containing protein [Crocinitomicaceae bacterium]
MNLKGIISISGKAGLFKVVAQGRNNIIVQALGENRKFPIFSTDKVSALEDISIYTYEEDMPLVDVYNKLANHEDFKKSINHKENGAELRKKTLEFLPDYDEDRVHDSDLKKLFQWYNLLVSHKVIDKNNTSDEEE